MEQKTLAPLPWVLPQCQSILDDGKDTPCSREAVYRVFGLGDNPWSGYHCGDHAHAMKVMFAHQGGCRLMNLTDGITRTYLANEKAAGAPENSVWGYLPCGCSNDGFGEHLR